VYKNIEVGFGRNFAGLFVSLAIAANAYPNSRNTGCNCRLQFSVVLQENARNDRCTQVPICVQIHSSFMESLLGALVSSK
jgi:hypothetical protein